MTQKSLNNKQLLISILCLIGIIALFELTDLDWYVQDYFYNFTTKQWLIDRNEVFLELLLYSGMKKVLIVFAAGIIVSLIFLRKKSFVQEYKKGLLVVVLSAILIPAIVGFLKDISNTPCPKNIERYNGSYPNVKVFEYYPESFQQEFKIRCWPAGHASGGFALLSLFFLFKTPKNKKRALVFALFIGWNMGFYKMFIGDHFLSHTIITMLLAWVIILMINNIFEKLINQ